jgi:hypothetical protein
MGNQVKTSRLWMAVLLLAGAAGAFAQNAANMPLPPLPGAVNPPATPTSDAGALVPALPSATLPLPAATTDQSATATTAPATDPAAARASASDIDALLPPQAQKTSPAIPDAAKKEAATAEAANPTASTAPAAPLAPTGSGISPSVALAPNQPPVADDVGGSALSQAAQVDVTAGPKKPLSLAEEAALMGISPPAPQIGLPPLPDATAQALLSGQPLGDYEDDTPLPVQQPRKKRKPSYRDLPKLKSSIAPLNRGYNYRRTLLPPSIYRVEYTAENKHLPRATYREDYERHLFGAVAANDLNATRAFLNRGQDVNLTNARGETLLMTAIRYRAFDTARLLLARGADPRSGGTTGYTPRQLAESTGQADLVMVLASRGG